MLPVELRIERHEAVGSTQDVARAALDEGRAVHGLVIRAQAQTQGRGRLERPWASAEGGSYQTLVLADGSKSFQTGRTPIAVAVGIAETLSAGGVEVSLKWPNDLYRAGEGFNTPRCDESDGGIGHRLDSGLDSGLGESGGRLDGKLGGILCEHVRGHLLVGVGINVRNRLPAAAAGLPSLEPDEVSDIVLRGIREGLNELLADPALPGHFARFDLLAGRRLRVIDGGRELNGWAAGIDADGYLVLASDSGTSRTSSGRIVEIDAAAD